MPIANVVFDLGRVLVDFSMNGFVEFLHAHGAALQDTKDFIERSRLHEYEHGFISNDEFLDAVCSLCSVEPDRAVLAERWVRIFSPIPQMTEFAQALRADYKVFILSNTSALHWQYLLDNFRLEDLADGWLTSFEAGAMKPAPKIFREAESRFKIKPEESIFIDDLVSNVEGARACGWQGLVHLNPEDTMRALRKLGVSPRSAVFSE